MTKALTFVFAGLILLLQYPLWFGKGGWLRAWDLDRQVNTQKKTNDDLKRRNAGLEAEVKDLKNGLEAIEERARFELGMVKDNEVFFQVLENAPASASSSTSPATSPASKPGSNPAAAK
jgi:cell division protein FtsB